MYPHWNNSNPGLSTGIKLHMSIPIQNGTDTKLQTKKLPTRWFNYNITQTTSYVGDTRCEIQTYYSCPSVSRRYSTFNLNKARSMGDRNNIFESCNQPSSYVRIMSKASVTQSDSVRFLTCTFRASCYSTRLSWAHTPFINWAVCLGQMVSS